MIKLHKESEQLIKDTFSRYTEVNKYVPSAGATIIHMYPVEDTKNPETGELNGYIDALLCDVHVYDIERKTVYKTKNKDGMDFLYLHGNVKIFKDGSTMVSFYEPVDILFGSSMSISRRNK